MTPSCYIVTEYPAVVYQNGKIRVHFAELEFPSALDILTLSKEITCPAIIFITSTHTYAVTTV
jgi:hypothetical protein